MDKLILALQPQALVDFFDNSSHWRLAKVVSYEAETKRLSVVYRKLGQLFSEECQADSGRVAWLRQHTSVETDPVYSERLVWEELDERIKVVSSQLEQLTDLGTGEPFETRQFLRGLLPTTVDSCLTHRDWTPGKVEVVQSFFRKVLDFVIQWLTASEHLFAAGEDSDPAVVSSAWPELFKALTEVLDLNREQIVNTIIDWISECNIQACVIITW